MVLCRTGSARTREQVVAEAVLDAGRRAGLSHHSDAAWFDLNGFLLRPLHVTRLRDATSTPSRLSVIHEPRLLPDHHLTIHRGVSVIVPSRIPFDIAALGDAGGAERALDRGWARHILNSQSSYRMLDELAGKGRKGITLMRELLDARGPDYRPNDTNLEDRFQELCRVVGLVLERQRNLADMGEWLGRVDFVSEKLMVVIEVDSALYHDAIIDRGGRRRSSGHPRSRRLPRALVHRPRDLPRPRRHAGPPPSHPFWRLICRLWPGNRAPESSSESFWRLICRLWPGNQAPERGRGYSRRSWATACQSSVLKRNDSTSTRSSSPWNMTE